MGIVKNYLQKHPFCKFTNEKLAAELGITELQVKKEMLFLLADECPYSVAETAAVFEISKDAAKKLIQSLPSARKISGRWYANIKDVQAAYKMQNPTPAPEPSSIGGCGARNWFAD